MQTNYIISIFSIFLIFKVNSQALSRGNCATVPIISSKKLFHYNYTVKLPNLMQTKSKRTKVNRTETNRKRAKKIRISNFQVFLPFFKVLHDSFRPN